MKAKTARVYTLEELKEKSQKALVDPKLVEIVKTAPLNNEGKVNCTWAYKEAEKYVHGEIKDLQKTKELAVAARFLAMLHRDFAEEFEKLVAQEKQPKPMTERENFFQKEFKLPNHATITTRTNRNYDGDFSEVSILFPEWVCHNMAENAMDFSFKILSAILEDNDLSCARRGLRDNLIQFLEEKFGLQIKVCGNCKRYVWHADKKWGQCFYHVPDGYPGEKVNFSDVCEKDWAPKEVSEKPSSA